MDKPLLNDPQIFPSEEILKNILGKSYPAFEDLMRIITEPDFGLIPGWHYYRDGKSWLCKVCFKKKTVFWLSVKDRYFKTTFYFTEKNSVAISALGISEHLKEDFRKSKHSGKLIPLTITISRKEEIQDLLKIAGYKKTIK